MTSHPMVDKSSLVLTMEIYMGSYILFPIGNLEKNLIFLKKTTTDISGFIVRGRMSNFYLNYGIYNIFNV